MSQTLSLSGDVVYCLQRVCRAWNVAYSTVCERWRRYTQAPVVAGDDPHGPCSDRQLSEHIRTATRQSQFQGEGYRKIGAKLRCGVISVSKERARRLIREHGLQAPKCVGHRHGPKAYDGAIARAKPDEIWEEDVTTTVKMDDGKVMAFVAVDHSATECMGIHSSKSQCRSGALGPLRQGGREKFGAFAKNAAEGLKVRHDRGSQYVAEDFQDELKFLGGIPSPSFVRETQSSGCAERFIRTPKEHLLCVHTFEAIEQFRFALFQFKRNYYEQ